MSRSSSEIAELASGKIGRVLLKYSWPALVAMTLNALYSVVDRAFIGWCGVDAMAGLQIAMPVMMLLTAFGPLVGVGHAAVLSIKLGENDRVSCEKLVGETVALKIAFYAVLIPLLYIYIDPLLSVCGADKVTAGARSAAKSYLEIVLFSHLFSHLAFGLSALHRAEGGAIRSMMCMVVGFGANMVLDPLLIFGFGMGIEGAAWATDVAMLLSCLCAFWYYWSGKTVIRLRLRRVWIYPKLLVRTLAIGLAPFLQQLMSAVIVASLQIAFAKWMPDEAARTDEIASLGVFSSALILVFMPILGCQQGLQPLFGYNWGARNFRRVLATLKTGFIVTSALTFLAFDDVLPVDRKAQGIHRAVDAEAGRGAASDSVVPSPLHGRQAVRDMAVDAGFRRPLPARDDPAASPPRPLPLPRQTAREDCWRMTPPPARMP